MEFQSTIKENAILDDSHQLMSGWDQASKQKTDIDDTIN